jgi:hypothetical protein
MKLINKEAQVGDYIRAYSFEESSGCHSDYYEGVVTSVVVCPDERVPYVYYTAVENFEVERYSGEVESQEKVNREMRIVQNGLNTTRGGKTQYIRVIERS